MMWRHVMLQAAIAVLLASGASANCNNARNGAPGEPGSKGYNGIGGNGGSGGRGGIAIGCSTWRLNIAPGNKDGEQRVDSSNQANGGKGGNGG